MKTRIVNWEKHANKAKRQFYQAIINYQSRGLHRVKSKAKLHNESYLFYFLCFGAASAP